MTFRGGVQTWGGRGDPKQPICSDEQRVTWRKQQPRCQRDDNIYNCSARGEGCGSCSVKVNTEDALCVWERVACEALLQRKLDSLVAEITVGECPDLIYWQIMWEDVEDALFCSPFPFFSKESCYLDYHSQLWPGSERVPAPKTDDLYENDWVSLFNAP